MDLLIVLVVLGIVIAVVVSRSQRREKTVEVTHPKADTERENKGENASCTSWHLADWSQ